MKLAEYRMLKADNSTEGKRAFALAMGDTHEVQYLNTYTDNGQTFVSYSYHCSRVAAEDTANEQSQLVKYAGADGHIYTCEALTFGPIGGNVTVQAPTKKRVDTALNIIRAQFNNPEYMAEFMKRLKETERGTEQVLKSAQIDWEKIYQPRNYRSNRQLTPLSTHPTLATLRPPSYDNPR